jgi:predicted PurR-regulated permease PerM
MRLRRLTDDLPVAPTVSAGRRVPPWVLAGIAVVLALLAWRLADVLLLLFGGVILATALRTLAAPLVERVRVSPRMAILAVVVLVALAFALFVSLVGDRLSEQFENLQRRLPDAWQALTRWLSSHPGGQPVLDMWESAKQGEVPWTRVVNVASTTLGALGAVALIVFVGIYLAVDPVLYRRGLLRLVPLHYRDAIDEALSASGTALSKWLMGQSVSMLFVGIATAIGLEALGMPLALSLGVIAGLLTFIPFFGALGAGVLAVLFAFTQGPQQALYVAFLAIAIQQVEGHLLTPLVQRWAVQLPPVLSIMSSVVFGLLFGLVGVLFATPLMVVAMTLIEKLYVERFVEAREAGVR